MRKLTLFFNDACSKCRATIALVEKSGHPFEIVEYLKTPPSAETLKSLGLSPDRIARKGEPRFRELGLDTNPPVSEDGWWKILSENPILIERPILWDGKRAVIGRPPENVLPLLEER